MTSGDQAVKMTGEVMDRTASKRWIEIQLYLTQSRQLPRVSDR